MGALPIALTVLYVFCLVLMAGFGFTGVASYRKTLAIPALRSTTLNSGMVSPHFTKRMFRELRKRYQLVLALADVGEHVEKRVGVDAEELCWAELVESLNPWTLKWVMAARG